MTFQADKFEEIRRRQEEIEAERNLALTGSAIETVESTGDYWPTTIAADYDPA